MKMFKSDRPSIAEDIVDAELRELAHLYRTAPVGLSLKDRNLRYLRINERLAALHGKSVEEHIGKTMHEVVPDIAKVTEPIYRKVIETGEPILNNEITAEVSVLPGEEKTFLTSYYPLKTDDGVVWGISNVVIETTDQKKAETRKSELDYLYRTAPIGLCLVDKNLRILRINEQMTQFNGVSAEWAIGKTVREVAPEVADFAEPRLREVLRTGKPITSAEWVGEPPAMPGVERTYLCAYYPLKNANGQVWAVSNVIKDVTGRRKAERRFQLLAEKTTSVPWEADAKTWLFTYVGDQAEQLLGYPANRWLEKDFWLDHIHPDDREPSVQLCLKGMANGETYELEYRMLAKDGRVIWIWDIVSVDVVNGEPTTLRGFLIDISDRKAAETALTESQETLRQLARQLLIAQDNERRNLARELHDVLSQRLAIASIELGKLQERTQSVDFSKQLALIQQHLVELSEDVHGMSRRLHPSVLEDLGLSDAIRAECESFQRREGIAVSIDTCTALTSDVPSALSVCMFRVLQESLRNIARHANASAADVSLSRTNGELVLRVQDDGIGFDQNRRIRGIGLVSMLERVKLIDGKLSVQSALGNGTTVEVRADLEH